MAINLTKILNQVQDRINDSATTERDLDKLIKVADRINNSGVQVKTYRSTGQLPTLTDSAYIGTIAYVSSDNIFGDSDGRFYYASGTDSGWRGFTTTQDSAEALIEAPSGEDATEPSVRQASNFGFTAGAVVPSVAPSWNYIQKFSLTADENATDIGDTLDYTGQAAGASSSTHGYMMGGFTSYGPNAPARINVIQKYSHTVDGNATDAGDLLATVSNGSGGFSPTHGYQFGGQTPVVNTIQKFEFASDGDGADVGDLTDPTRYNASSISSTHIYNHGGYPSTDPSGDYVNRIEKFSMSVDGNATDVGDLSAGVGYHSGVQSDTDGYRTGGNGAVPAPGSRNEIEKFPFAADGNATDVGDLTLARYAAGNGTSSTASGYTMGGYAAAYSNVIDKFPFASGGNAADVGDMIAAYGYYAQTQN